MDSFYCLVYFLFHHIVIYIIEIINNIIKTHILGYVSSIIEFIYRLG
jgi:hypothetical protein